jgi:Uma2 family endonuclease
MSTATLRKPSPVRSLRLSDVDWKTYSRILDIFGERPGFRVTYDRGELEIMSPTLAHDDDNRLLGHMVLVLTEELNLPLKHGGSTTMRRRLLQRGVEADTSFWIANAHRMQGRRELNLSRDPPPDLAIEVDVTRSSLKRLAIYEALRVPEVWRLKNDVLTFHVLGSDAKYATSANGLSFPLVSPADILGFLKRARQAKNVNTVVRDFRAWIRKRLANQ